MYRCFCNRNSGFSLIEIIIAGLIVLALMGILLPVLWQARDKSRTTTCASNLRQLYQAFSLYAQDNDGRLPIYQNAQGISVGCDNDACGGTWKKIIPEKGKEMVEVLLPYTKSQDMWFCPSDIFARTEATSGRILHKYSSYLANQKLGQQLLFNEPFTLQGWTSAFGQTLTDTATIPLLTEDLFGLDCRFPGQAKPPYSHQQRFHTLYLDGHIQLLSWDACERSTP